MARLLAPTRATVRQTLDYLAQAESEAERLYRVTLQLHAQGVLSDVIRGDVASRLAETYEAERMTRTAIVTIAGSQGITAALLARAVPEPTPPPELPPAQIVGGAIVAEPPADVAAATRNALQVALPAWAVVVIAGLVILGVAGIVLGLATIGADTFKAVMLVRENTERIRLEIEGRLRCFTACMGTASGARLGCAVACRFLIQVPLEEQDKRWPWYVHLAVWGTLGATVVGGLYVMYQYGGGRERLRSTRAPRLRPT